MGTKVGALEIDIRAAIADLKRDFAQAKAESGKLAGEIGKSNQAIAKSFGLASSAVKGFVAGIAAIGVGGAVAGLVGFTRASIDAVGGLGELAEQVGIDVERLQEFQFAASQSGVAAENLEQGFTKLADKIGEAAKLNDEAIKSFDDIGVKIFAVGGKLKSTEEIFLLVADAISKIDEPARRTQALIDLFGKSGAKLAPLLSQGSAGLQEFARQARDLGLVMDSALVKRTDEAGDRFAALNESIGSNLKKAVVTAALPALEALNRTLQTTLEMVGSSGGLVGKIRELDAEWSASIRRGFADTLGKLPGMGFLEDEAREAEGRLAELRANQRRLAAERENAPAGEPLKISIGGSNPVGKNARKQALADEEKATRDLIAATRELDQQERSLEGATDGLYALELERAKTKRELGESLAEEIAKNDQLLQALQLGTAEYERQRAVVEELAKYKRAGIQLSDEERQAIEEQSRTLGEQRRQIDDTIQAEKDRAEVARDLTKVIGTAAEEALLKGANASDVARAALEDFRRVLLRAFVTKPIEAWGTAIVDQITRINSTPINLQAGVNGGGGGGLGGIFGAIGGLFGGLFGGGSLGGFGAGDFPMMGGTLFAASGADFTVGGRPGVDQNVMQMALTKGERVKITPANDTGGRGGDTYMIDARGADSAGLARLERTVRELNGSIEKRAVSAVTDHNRRIGASVGRRG